MEATISLAGRKKPITVASELFAACFASQPKSLEKCEAVRKDRMQKQKAPDLPEDDEA